MRKRKLVPSLLWLEPLHQWRVLCWFTVGLGVWILEQFLHGQNGTPFSPVLFLKGTALLGAAALIYRRADSSKKFSTLGLFPLVWLAASRFQWNLCAGEWKIWGAVALFLLAEGLLAWVRDGQKLFVFLTPLWAILAWAFPFMVLLPLSFLTIGEARLKKSAWLRWGGLGVALVLVCYFRIWNLFSPRWTDGLDLLRMSLWDNGFYAFLILGWLGLVAFSAKSPLRHLIWPMFFLIFGFLFWVNPADSQGQLQILEWILVFCAGFGLEAFRRDLMDPSWHARLLWGALGVALLGGTL